MSLSVSDATRLIVAVVVNCCFAATFLVFLGLMAYWGMKYPPEQASKAMMGILPETGGVGVLLAACTTIQSRLLASKV
jgi:quinol-cytochrome oxidoreductase complex cytochrome b subunit